MKWHHMSKRFDPAAFHANAEPEVKWIIEHLTGDERLVLDVGCLDSGLMDMLSPTYPGMVGIDIRRQVPESKYVKLMDIRKPEFTNGVRFDAIIFLSTLEHIGLSCYGNEWLDPTGDLQALAAAKQLLSWRGSVLVTAPFHPDSTSRRRGGSLWERRYSHASAMSLVGAVRLKVIEYLEDRRNEIICMELANDTED